MAVKGDIPWNKGLTKDSDPRINYPRPGSFPKGNKPWNKDVKGIHLSPNTEFKKGQVSDKLLPISSLTIRKTKKGSLRRFIKTGNPNVWVEYGKWLWVSKYGPLISGDVTHHINGNRLDDREDNIIALPRCDHPIFHNKWWLKPLSEEQLKFYIGRYTTYGY
jgi:3D (Asp-Asp-Asp) domain-containing protein